MATATSQKGPRHGNWESNHNRADRTSVEDACRQSGPSERCLFLSNLNPRRPRSVANNERLKGSCICDLAHFEGNATLPQTATTAGRGRHSEERGIVCEEVRRRVGLRCFSLEGTGAVHDFLHSHLGHRRGQKWEDQACPQRAPCIAAREMGASPTSVRVKAATCSGQHNLCLIRTQLPSSTTTTDIDRRR